MMAMSLTLSAEARTVLARIDPEVATKKSVAMALETYNGDFYDVSQIKWVWKTKGNAQKIMKKDYLKLKGGGELDVHSIKYFIVEKKVRPSALKMPVEDN